MFGISRYLRLSVKATHEVETMSVDQNENDVSLRSELEAIQGLVPVKTASPV